MYWISLLESVSEWSDADEAVIAGLSIVTCAGGRLLPDGPATT